MKKTVILAVLALILLALLSSCASKEDKPLTDVMQKILAGRDELLRARVTQVLSDSTEETAMEGAERTVRTVLFGATIQAGEYKGYSLEGRQTIDSMTGYAPRPVSEGDGIFLYLSEDADGAVHADFTEYNRIPAILWLVGAFAAALLIIGRTKGLRALVALVVTCAGIFLFFLPYVANGGSPIWSSIAVCVLVTLATNLIVAGFTIKALSATLGCLSGLLLAGLFASLSQTLMKLTGLVDDHSVMLAYSTSSGLNMNGLVFAAVIIGAMGAAMDVAISVASSIEELSAKTSLKPMELTRSGLKIGRDIMGTMANTLILAYVGGALHLILLIAVNGSQLSYVISWELISTEVVRAVAGSLGLILAVPATALVSGWLIGKFSKTAPPKDAGDAAPATAAPPENPF